MGVARVMGQRDIDSWRWASGIAVMEIENSAKIRWGPHRCCRKSSVNTDAVHIR